MLADTEIKRKGFEILVENWEMLQYDDGDGI